MRNNAPFQGGKKFSRPNLTNSDRKSNGKGLANLIQRRAETSKNFNADKINLDQSLPSLLIRPKSSEAPMEDKKLTLTPQKEIKPRDLPSITLKPQISKFYDIDDIDLVNQEVFKNSKFMPFQREIILQVLKGKDVFVCLPTGAGKSLTFQLSAILTPGITIVIMPLLSLIHDQFVHLQELNVNARVLNSMQSLAEQNKIFEEIENDHSIKLLFLTPERISQSGRMKELMNNLYFNRRIAKFAIDEAHCISKWGRDFRTDYFKLSSLRDEYPTVPIIALTASATEKIRQDTINVLNMRHPEIFLSSYNRPNLCYSVLPKTSHINEDIAHFIKENHINDTGIIYCLSKDECSHLAKVLKRTYKIKADFYHSEVAQEKKLEIHEKWRSGELQVIVATIAFGMGIDKGDVRFIIHCSFPKSIDGYYQETGRAGRDGNVSNCVLFYSQKDKSRHGFIIGSSYQGSSHQDYNELSKMIDYCENRTTCRRASLLSYFGEIFDANNCKFMCDNCKAGRLSVEKDFTEIAIHITDVLEGPRYGINTLLQLTAFLLGKDKKYENLEHFGLLRVFDYDLIEKIVKKMILEQVLQEKSIKTFNNTFAYIEIGPNMGKFRRGEIRIVVKSELKGAEKLKYLQEKTVKTEDAKGLQTEEIKRNYGKCQQKEVYDEIKCRLSIILKRFSNERGVTPQEILTTECLENICLNLHEHTPNIPAEINKEIKHFKRENNIPSEKYEFELDLESVDIDALLKRKIDETEYGIKKVKASKD